METINNERQLIEMILLLSMINIPLNRLCAKQCKKGKCSICNRCRHKYCPRPEANQTGLEMESLIICKGITEVAYKVMDTTKQFTGIRHTTNVKYKSKTEKEVGTKNNK